jgi:hypothetical protein
LSDIPGVGEVDYVQMLELLDVSNVHLVGVSEIGFSCIFTDNHPFGDQHPSCHMSRRHGAWRCKSCHRRGGVIDFVGSVRHCAPLDALRWLRTHFGDVYAPPKDGDLVKDVRERMGKRYATTVDVVAIDESQTVGPSGIFRVDWNDDLHPAVQYMVGERGLDPSVLERFEVGWDSWTSRVVLPYRDSDGVLVGFNGRAIKPNSNLRYMVLGDDAVKESRYGVGYGFDMMRVENHLFGLDRAIEALREVAPRDREIVVIEGEINQLTLAQGLSNVVSAGNAWLSETQIMLLRRHASSIVSLFDSDDAGETATWGGYDVESQRSAPGLVQRLSPFMPVRVAAEHEGDPNSMGLEAALELVATAKPWLRAMIE